MQLQADKDDMEDQMNLVIDEQLGKISKLEQVLSELIGQNRIGLQSQVKHPSQLPPAEKESPGNWEDT